MNITKTSIISNMFWKFSEQAGAQVVSLIIAIVLARLLAPDEFGMIAMVAVFITIANVFISSGFGNALIQKKDADNLDFSSVFFLSIGLSIILYGIIFVSAPIVANFYGYEMLTPVMRIMGLRIIVAAINTVQHAYVSRNMIFKKFFYSTLGGTLASAVVGITMAYMGFGVWALVAQYMVNITVDTIVLWFTVKWRPHLQFSLIRVKSLLSFGWKLLFAGLLDTLNSQSRHLIIGKMYTASDLAYYSKGMQFPALIMANINTSISEVMFPVVSKVQDDLERLKTLTRKSISVSSYFIFPMMMGLAVVADPFVELLLTEKWLPCVPYLRIACFTHAIIIMQIAMQNALMALGRSDVFLKMDIASKLLGIMLLISVINQGVMAIALTSVFTGTFNVVMKVIVSKRMFGYTYREHLSDNVPIIIAAVIMGVAVYLINLFGFSSIMTMYIQIPLGIAVYLLLSLLFKLEGFTFAQKYVKDILKKLRDEKTSLGSEKQHA